MSITTAAVTIIGGGIVGLSIAYHLRERGVDEVVVIERAHCGSGATLKATGGFRLQFGTDINVRLSLLARSFWRDFADRFARPIGWRERGYLFLATTAAQAAQQERNVARQQALGVPVRLVTPAEAARLSPWLNPDGVLAGTFCPWDATLEIEPVMAALVEDCRRQGIEIREATTVTGVMIEGDRVTGVTTTAGPISTPLVINAAGNEAATIGHLAGLTIPVRGERRQAAITHPFDDYDPAAPLTIDLGSGAYARPGPGGGALIGGGDRGSLDIQGEAVDPAGIDRLRHLVAERFPPLKGLELARAWVGRRPMAPDDHVILGATAVAGLLCACGAGSHGLMHAPAIGRLMAELVVEGTTTSIDISPLSLDRFARGELLGETVLF